MTYEELDSFIASNCRKVFGSGWTCSICELTSANKYDIARHIEAKHVILPELVCDICKYSCKTRDSLRRHIHKYHKD